MEAKRWRGRRRLRNRKNAVPTRTLFASHGATPTIDGIISPGEYDDAFGFSTADAPDTAPGLRGPNLWSAQFREANNVADSSLRGWVKYDAHSLYFGFEVLDDYLYGIDGPRWCPAGNPACEQLTPQGWPWFGDGVEVLINAAGRQHAGNSTVVGNATQWQMVCSLTKSRLGGIGTGGLCEGEPRQSADAWHAYRKWIDSGAMRCAARPRRTPRGFVVEFAVRFALLQLGPGQPYHPSMPHTPLGLNLALSDVDRPEQGDPTFGFHHENWLSGTRDNRTRLSQFGTLWMVHRGAGGDGVPMAMQRAERERAAAS